ncbi:PHA/PHB synthase family protein [Nocardioides sp.]|uniref:PHA/PHB synthase family protein n=1 Tax=Nocardioides sp. TaxID=35761 RepID=UPI0039E246A9
MLSLRTWGRLGAGLARQPGTLVRRSADLAAELVAIGLGTATRAPSGRDRRFTDPGWSQNPWLRRVLQAYLASAETLQSLAADVDLEWRDREKVDFAVDNVLDLLAPSNMPLISPAFWRAVIDTGGGNVVSGVRNLVEDLATAPRVPRMVERGAFAVGESLAATPGAVVLRTEVFELIQYAPRTEQVRQVPLLMVPPVINKYYVVDLAPGRSMVEHYLEQGHQVFAISWRNPDARHREWDFDTYGQAILDALDATTRVTGADRTHVMSICSGGMLTVMTLAHLARLGRLDRIASLGLAVSVIDNSKAGTTMALADERVARAAVAKSQAKGYLDGRALAEVFAWLRPNDLIWSYWVNNYLQGRKPAAFDVLYWNADTTRMAAGLHRDFVTVALGNSLTVPGAATMLGSPVDLREVTVPTYVVAGIADHISPWQSCYRTTRLLGGEVRFVLSSSGHVASMVNPPGNPKASFHVTPEQGDHPADPEQWLATADPRQGSWWPDHAAFLAERGGDLVDAPGALGGGGLYPLAPAPGSYVRDT